MTKPQRPSSAAKKAARIFLCSLVIGMAGCLVNSFFSNGPDTICSKKGFVRLVGYQPPATVSNIYYWYEELWLDPAYRLRFVASDPEVVTELIKDKQLQECRQKIVDAGGLDLAWWTEKNYKPELKCFCRESHHDVWHLWYDRVTGTVWYEEYST